jgi:hypothetical protein
MLKICLGMVKATIPALDFSFVVDCCLNLDSLGMGGSRNTIMGRYQVYYTPLDNDRVK